ncbi:hypothetical protein KIN34_07720 [Cellulomonas sp. DKR-3]|uniref:Uncharacterized protein n=1 Tax=Cellulomonas fulva TaxID=2835530 RepID=A0ABS5TYG4_9CELL|nr:hypothetical protein [Cellulomonas fulva]MBT0994171.1 hypothetical protein [Cellulomonas fulva]
MNDDLHSRLHALGDSPDLNRPVADLDAVVRRARARRQRSGRMLAGGVAVALVVAGTAAALPRLSHDAPPAVDAVSPNAPAACHMTPDELASDDLGVPLVDAVDGMDGADAEWLEASTTVLEDSVQPASTGPWRLTVQTDLTPETSTDPVSLTGWTYGTTVALVQQSRTVAVLDTFPAPPRAEARKMQVDAVPQPYPLTTEIEAPPVSCATGEVTELAPGTYQLVASTTAAEAGSTAPRVLRATSTPIDVLVAADSPAVDALGCGATDDELRALADPQTNPTPLRLGIETAPGAVTAGSELAFMTTVVNDGSDRVDATFDSWYPLALVTQGGVVVGGYEPVYDILKPPHDVHLGPGSTASFETWSGLQTCFEGDEGGVPLPPGAYELWSVITFTPERSSGTAEPDARQWSTAGGPWAFEITSTADGDDEPTAPTANALAVCGLALADLAADDGGVPSQTDPDATEPTGEQQWLSARSTIDATSVDPGSDGPWRLTTEIDVIPGPDNELLGPPDGRTFGSTVALLRDGVVVAVLETPSGAPTRAEAQQLDVVGEPHPFPLATELEAPLVSCATGQATELEPGDYQLVSSTTALVPVAFDDLRVIRATSTPVEVRVTPTSTGVGPLGCGATDDELRALADPPRNPPPVTVSATGPHAISEESSLTFPVTVANDTTGHNPLELGAPTVVVTRDGVIVGRDTADAGLMLAADAEEEIEVGTSLRSCAAGAQDPTALPPGDYELWLVLPVTLTYADEFATPSAEWQAVSGPWPLEITAL